jgi:hypothetical protein
MGGSDASDETDMDLAWVLGNGDAEALGESHVTVSLVRIWSEASLCSSPSNFGILSLASDRLSLCMEKFLLEQLHEMKLGSSGQTSQLAVAG